MGDICWLGVYVLIGSYVVYTIKYVKPLINASHERNAGYFGYWSWYFYSNLRDTDSFKDKIKRTINNTWHVIYLQLLASKDKKEDKIAPVVPGRLPAELLNKYNRFHPQVRYDNITFNCCASCKGEIEII